MIIKLGILVAILAISLYAIADIYDNDINITNSNIIVVLARWMFLGVMILYSIKLIIEILLIVKNLL